MLGQMVRGLDCSIRQYGRLFWFRLTTMRCRPLQGQSNAIQVARRREPTMIAPRSGSISGISSPERTYPTIRHLRPRLRGRANMAASQRLSAATTAPRMVPCFQGPVCRSRDRSSVLARELQCWMRFHARAFGAGARSAAVLVRIGSCVPEAR